MSGFNENTLNKQEPLEETPSIFHAIALRAIAANQAAPQAEVKKEEPSKPASELKQSTANGAQILAFAPKMIVECSLPSSVPKNIRVFERTNGHITLRLTQLDERHSLPYGRDRLLFFWLRTKTMKSKSKVIQFEGVNAALKEMNLVPEGKTISWLKDALLRLHHTDFSYLVGTTLEGGLSRGSRIIEEINGINFNEKRKKQSGTIVVSESFFNNAAIPIDLNEISKFGRSWIAIDLSNFIRKRLFRNKTKGDIYIPVREMSRQLGFNSDSEMFNIRNYLSRGMKILKSASFPAVPFFDKNDNIVIPNENLPNILSPEWQNALDKIGKQA